MFGGLRPSLRLLSRKEFYARLSQDIEGLKSAGLYKQEQIIASPQSSHVVVKNENMVNWRQHSILELIKAGREALELRGAGMSSVRFICGTQDLHKQLEERLSDFHQTEDTILYTSCFDANAGLFETLLGPEDVIISDSLNHASIIDGIRLCKAQRKRYKHNDMDDLAKLLAEARETGRTILIATDGVFSMDGDFAKLPEICELALKYDALVFVDDSHATGFVGKNGRGTPEHFGLERQVDIISSTLGKALGGSSGGYTTGRSEMITMLRQKSRPYLFSNSLPPVIASFALKALDLVATQPELRKAVNGNAEYFRKSMAKKGYKLMGNGNHPICPVLIGDAVLAGKMAQELRDQGIFVIAFSYPVVPKGLARIRVQLSAAHTKEQIDKAVDLFETIGKKYNII